MDLINWRAPKGASEKDIIAAIASRITDILEDNPGRRANFDVEDSQLLEKINFITEEHRNKAFAEVEAYAQENNVPCNLALVKAAILDAASRGWLSSRGSCGWV